MSLARIMTEKLQQGAITREEHDHIIATSIACVEASKTNPEVLSQPTKNALK